MDLDIETADIGKVVIVSDVGKQFGETFRKSFIQHLSSLTQGSNRDISIISYIEFIRSPYNDPAQKGSFPNIIFVFINGHNVQSDGYGVSGVTYQMAVQFLDQAPFISQEIEVGVPSSIWSSKSKRSVEFAQTVFKELHTRNVL
jgi:hypothetical protein